MEKSLLYTVQSPMDIGLVLEGGGMRGVYTAGVLDFLMDAGIWCKDVYGVSAGACHGSSYVSGQRGRAARTVLENVGDPRYASWRNLMTTGNFFGEKFVYEDIPMTRIPFDYDAYASSPMALHSVVFNCKSGETAYIRTVDLHKEMPVILASSSLPLLSKMVEIEGAYYLDGGIGDSIPLARAVADGHSKNLVVLTQHNGYQKQPNKMMPLIKARYRNYPALVRALAVRHEMYNEQLDYIKQQEAQGAAFVIRPSTPVTIRSMEKDVGALRALYEQGYADARQAEKRLQAFLV